MNSSFNSLSGIMKTNIGTQPENVCQACFKSKKYCYRYDGHDNICAFCHSSHSRCVRELSGGAVTAPPLYVSRVVHNYFVNV